MWSVVTVTYGSKVIDLFFSNRGGELHVIY
jgi:hypothetical protein